MANRHLLRTTVLQTLYEWDFLTTAVHKSKEDSGSSEIDPLQILERDLSEVMGENTDEEPFAKELVNGVVAKCKELDAVISKAAPEWPIENVSFIDRNILRLGLYELLFSDRGEVPPKVAINEAIELAKTFGGSSSSKFINGVLGSVYRELGEPGKDEGGQRIKNVNLPDDRVPTEELIGAVVVNDNPDDMKLALVHDVFGHWTLCKGHVKEGETENDAVARKVKEELGIECNGVRQKLGENSYIAYDPEKGKIKKSVKYFLVNADEQDLTPPEEGGITDAKWFQLEEAASLNFYKDIVPMIEKAVQTLLAEKGDE